MMIPGTSRVSRKISWKKDGSLSVNGFGINDTWGEAQLESSTFLQSVD